MSEVDPIHATQARLSKAVIKHSEFNKGLMKLRDAVHYHRSTGEGKHYVLTGHTGCGKTTLINSVFKEFPMEASNDRICIPIVKVDVPAKPTISNCASEILLTLGDPLFSKGCQTSKTDRIINYFHELGVSMLIMDEMQHFVDQRGERGPAQAAEWLKTLVTKAKVSTVISGVQSVEVILEVNSQMRRRFSRQIHLKPFSVDHSESLATFVGVLCAIDRELGLPDRFKMCPKAARAIHFATNGIMDYMVKLFVGAHEIAVNNRLQAINWRCLEEAFQENIWIDGEGEFNPFCKRFNFHPLDKPGMPFAA